MKTLSTILFATFGLSLFATSYAGQVNINTANADAIAANISGVGSKQAAAIVEYRTQNGAFQTLDDLSKVKGIGHKTIAKNQENILLEGEPKTAPVAPMDATDDDPAETNETTININLADIDQLRTLNGIGPAKASAIISYREANGQFESIDDLVKVRGIGAKTLAKNRARLALK